MSGRQEKSQHAYWCIIGNQQNNNQSPKKQSANKAGDKKNNDKITTDKACHGSKNVEGKKVETLSFKILAKQTKMNSAVTPSKDKQKNKVVDIHSYSAKRKKNYDNEKKNT